VFFFISLEDRLEREGFEKSLFVFAKLSCALFESFFPHGKVRSTLDQFRRSSSGTFFFFFFRSRPSANFFSAPSLAWPSHRKASPPCVVDLAFSILFCRVPERSPPPVFPASAHEPSFSRPALRRRRYGPSGFLSRLDRYRLSAFVFREQTSRHYLPLFAPSRRYPFSRSGALAPTLPPSWNALGPRPRVFLFRDLVTGGFWASLHSVFFLIHLVFLARYL